MDNKTNRLANTHEIIPQRTCKTCLTCSTLRDAQHHRPRRLRYKLAMNNFHLFLIIVVLSLLVQRTEGVDVARNKPITAKYTCGYDVATSVTGAPERYIDHDQMFVEPMLRVVNVCEDTTVHAPSMMVDGNDQTWWQSMSRPRLINQGNGVGGIPQAEVILDMLTIYEVQSIRIRISDSKRPGSMCISKSDDGVEYAKMFCYVETTDDCMLEYGVPSESTISAENLVICTTYSGNAASRDEILFFDFTTIPTALGSWRDARFIKLDLNKLHITFGLNGEEFQHFTISQLEVEAECVCNGQNDDCGLDESGQFSCVCGGNTDGEHCEICLPKFNQEPYQYGTACTECQCYGHADSCIYDENVAAAGGSIDITGQLSGGGVCQNCRDNTAGNNCNECISYYYRPSTVLPTDPLACRPCVCDPAGAGIGRNPTTGLFGDCISNAELAVARQQNPGDCYCKENVQGTSCTECKPGFFNLNTNNPQGCEACFCNVAGTQGGSLVCDGSMVSGQCPCKTNVVNRNCDTCRAEFYGLSDNLPEGCLPCNCVQGASRTLLCDAVSGQCDCRTNLEGLQCIRPLDTYFSSGPHYLSGEFEDINSSWLRTIEGYYGYGYATVLVGTPAQTTIVIPTISNLSGKYYILLRYIAEFQAVATLRIIGSGTLQQYDVNFPNCPTWCYKSVGWNNDIDIQLLRGVSYMITIQSTAQLSMDRAVALPWEYVNALTPPLGDGAVTFSTECDVVRDDMQIGEVNEEYCKNNMYRLATYYYDRALPCDCHPLGSYNSSCEQYGGACHCKPGVTGRKCDTCLLDYFNLSETGCQHCGCEGGFNVCDDTGQCLCPPNVVGRTCDTCADTFWNFNSTTGCEPCNCDPSGSYIQQCDLTSGECDCKPGVAPGMCNICLPSYKSFSSTGCVPCNCDMAGSESSECENNGQCPCKANTVGQICNACTSGSFNLAAEHVNGCLECVCNGVSDTCGPSNWRFEENTIPIADDEGLPALVLSTDQVAQSQYSPAFFEIEGNRMLRATNVPGNPIYYWMPLNGLTGNLLGLYETTVSFTVFHTSAQTGGLMVDAMLAVVDTDRNVFKLHVDPVPMNVMTRVNVTITNENFIQEQENITRGEFLEALSRVAYIMPPATYYSMPHETSIFDITYTIASATGTGPLASSVEQCTCPIGYAGTSCERCTPGYTRDLQETSLYLGNCVPCNCHSHATMCDPETGECADCQHNTAGLNCETCADGFFGDATIGTVGDCAVCPCYSPRVDNSTCALDSENVVRCSYCAEGYRGRYCDECDTFYSGNPEVPLTGTCELCFCNNNADSCDAGTGNCNNCGNQTSGAQCQVCQPGFYGNASIGVCDECACAAQGSISTVCDAISGQCPCKSGVGERDCSTCLENHYGFNDVSLIGCVPCGCNEFGSSAPQCDETGACPCLSNVQGRICDQCTSGFFGLPSATCEVCGCSETGSVAATTCNAVTGQCECLEGVSGRTCDGCDRMFTGTTATGCTQCTGCQLALGEDAYELVDNWYVYWNATLVVGAVEAQDLELQVLSATIDETLINLGISNDNLNAISALMTNISASQSLYGVSVSTLDTRGDTLLNDAGLLENNTRDELIRQEVLQEQATNSSNMGAQLQQDLTAELTTLRGWNESAHELLILGSQEVDFPNDDFVSQRRYAQAELTNITTQQQQVGVIAERVEEQHNETGQLEISAQNANDDLTNFQAEIADINTNVTAIHQRTTQIWSDYNTTLNNKLYADELLLQSMATLDETELILSGSAQNISSADIDRQNLQFLIYGYETSNDPFYPELAPEVPTALQPVFRQGLRSVALPYLQSEYNQMSIDIVQVDERINASLVIAEGLRDTIETLRAEYERVQPNGQTAVDALENYGDVVTMLEEAETLAAQAQVSVADAQAAMATVTVADIQAQALAADSSSRLMNETIRLRTSSANGPIFLNAQLDSANASLQISIEYLELLELDLQRFESIMEALETASADPDVDDTLTATNTAAEMAIRAANDILEDEDMNIALQTQTTLVENTVQTVEESTTLMTNINNELANFNDNLENSIQNNLDSTEALRVETDATRERIEALLADLEAKVAIAEARLVTIKQPVGFSYDSYERLQNPSGGLRSLLYNEIRMDFRHNTLEAQGLLFFVENTGSNEVLALQIVNQQLMFIFNNMDEVLRITSPAELCNRCWFRVIASRYARKGKLTVIKLSTGGFVTNALEGSSADSYLALNSDIYVGGLPGDYQTDKVDQTTQFSGCLYNVYFDQQPLDIWSTLVTTTSLEGQCCAQPPVLPTSATIEGITFGGFGRMMIDPVFVNVSQPAQIKLEFRTFEPNGVILLIMQPEIRDYYGLFVVNGLLQFEYGVSPSVARVTSDHTFNNGQWYHVTLTHSPTVARMSVGYVDTSTSSVISMWSQENPIGDTTRLLGASIIFGGQNPSTSTSPTGRGPTDRPYAGYIRNIQRTLDGAFEVLVPVPQADLPILSSENVYFDGCYLQTLSGIQMRTEMAFVEVPQVISSVDSISFTIITHDPDGILVFGQSRTQSNRFFYIALFNGDVFMYYNEGSGLSSGLRTTNLYIADGQRHIVRVVFSSIPVLIVDDESHYSTTTMSPRLTIPNGQVYMGGVPQSVSLAGELPVKTSIQGGIRNLNINDAMMTIDFSDPETVQELNQQDADLSGIPMPTSVIPDPPYEVTVAPPTDTTPTCGSPFDATYSDIGLRFGSGQDSFINYDLTNLGHPDLFHASFTLTIEFRAVESNGIMVYAADTTEGNPLYYFCLYMDDGFLVFSMDTNSAISNSEASPTKLLTSRYKYDDAQFYSVTVLRINDFLAMIVQSRQDYKNNLISSTQTTSILDIQTPLYIGGVPSTFGGLPFTSVRDIGVGNEPFHGCIRNVEVATHLPLPYTFNMSDPAVAVGTEACYDSVIPGVHMNGNEGAYLQVTSPQALYDFYFGFQATIVFRTTERDATLVIIYQSNNAYMLLDIYNGVVRLVLSDGASASQPFAITSANMLDSVALCDNDVHTIQFAVNDNGVTLTIDETIISSRYPTQFSFVRMDQVPIYLGGVPTAVSWTFQDTFAAARLTGCIEAFRVGATESTLSSTTDSVAVTVGCPGPPIAAPDDTPVVP